MITQIELEIQEGGRNKVYWVKHEPYNDEVLKKGAKIILAEEGVITPLTIRRTFVSLPDNCVLPPKSRVGTPLEILN